MLDNVEGPVHHLAYERGEDVIVMKGYKFAKAKTAAAAILGCLALANPTLAAYLVQVPYRSNSLLALTPCTQLLLQQCPSVLRPSSPHCLGLTDRGLLQRVLEFNYQGKLQLFVSFGFQESVSVPMWGSQGM